MTHLNGQIDKANILNGSYASSTSANESESSISDSTNSSSSNTLTNTETRNLSDSLAGLQNEKYTKTKNGFDLKMTNAEKIMEFRKTVFNYYEDIIKECNSLFFALF